MVAQAYVRKIGGIDVPSGTTTEEFVAAYREKLAKDRADRAVPHYENGDFLYCDACGEQITDTDYTISGILLHTRCRIGSMRYTDGLHDPDCDCVVCRTNDRLGYDADVSDPSQYCRHGTFVGSWWGPDYMCGMCESGEEPVDWWIERRKRRTRHIKGHGRNRIGTKTLRDLVAHMIELDKREQRASEAWQKTKSDMPEWQKKSLAESRDVARRAEIDYRFAYFGLMTEEQKDWVSAIFHANERIAGRAAIAEVVAKITKARDDGMVTEQECEEYVERITRQHKHPSKRVDPLAYHEPRSNVTEAMERQEALRVWFRGIYAEMDRDCLAWLDMMIAEWKEGNTEQIGRTEFLRAITAEKFGDEVREGYPVDDAATDYEIAKMTGAYFWWRVDAWRRTEAGRVATGA